MGAQDSLLPSGCQPGHGGHPEDGGDPSRDARREQDRRVGTLLLKQHASVRRVQMRYTGPTPASNAVYYMRFHHPCRTRLFLYSNSHQKDYHPVEASTTIARTRTRTGYRSCFL